MSIATLKKKVQSEYNNSSVNAQHGFSINGTTRNQGFVGQTMLSRSLPRTPYRGAFPMGNGGCCGKFQIAPSVQSGVYYMNDPTLIKSSVISAQGVMDHTVRCVPLRTCNPTGNTVKPDVNRNKNTQHQYVEWLSKKAMDISGCEPTDKKPDCHRCKKPRTNYNYSFVNIVSDPNKSKSMSQNEYIQRLQTNCVKTDKPAAVPDNKQKTPFGCGVAKIS